MTVEDGQREGSSDDGRMFHRRAAAPGSPGKWLLNGGGGGVNRYNTKTIFTTNQTYDVTVSF